MTDSDVQLILTRLQPFLLTDPHARLLAERLLSTAVTMAAGEVRDRGRAEVVADVVISLIQTNARLQEMMSDHLKTCVRPVQIGTRPPHG